MSHRGFRGGRGAGQGRDREFGKDDIVRLLNVTVDPAHRRGRFPSAMSALVGLSAPEIVHVKMDDLRARIDGKKHVVDGFGLRVGKGKRERVVPLTELSFRFIMEQMSDRTNERNEPVFFVTRQDVDKHFEDLVAIASRIGDIAWGEIDWEALQKSNAVVKVPVPPGLAVRCGEELVNPETDGKVRCHGAPGHDMRCLAKTTEGKWVTWDYDGGAMPPILSDAPPRSYIGWPFAERSLEPDKYEPWPEGWVVFHFEDTRTGRPSEMAVPPDVAEWLRKRIRDGKPKERLFTDEELVDADEHIRDTVRRLLGSGERR